MTDLNGRGMALHFTFLRSDGNRVVQIEEDPKIMYGPVKGARAVRSPGAVANRVALSPPEGIETGPRSKHSSGMLAGGFDLLVWAALSFLARNREQLRHTRGNPGNFHRG